jgi:asparagine synthase (glutamine-hydrolysing)
MSILFGVRQQEGIYVRKDELLALSNATHRWACDGTSIANSRHVGMGFQPYYTHERALFDCQPLLNEVGDMVTLDGQLDNHEALRSVLGISDDSFPDSKIVLLAFERWGQDCFSRFVGDWAIVLWCEREESLYLARDHAGTRTLYYEQRGDRIRWATFLETLLLEDDHNFDSEYLERYLACLPTQDLTPYTGIRAVRPAHFVRLSSGKAVSTRHWQCLVEETIRYKDDVAYEEHFRSLLRESVERRTGKGAEILAHLSGGMDSTSIVCMSDYVRNQNGATPDQLLDTISYFDDAEPHWNERPYVALVEQRRGKTGIHIATREERSLEFLSHTYTVPGPDESTFARERSLMSAIGDVDYRVILSGVGGDECFGGIATGLPELADYIRAADIFSLTRRGLAWGLAMRQPLWKVLRDAGRFFGHSYFGNSREEPRGLPPWVCSQDHHSGVDSEHQRLYRYRPSAIANAAMWEPLTESLPQTSRGILRRFEYRYPYLDRDLVDFVFRIPKEQLIRPGRRRSLMRRAMSGILPSEIIERRRKAYIVRGPLSWFERRSMTIDRLFSRSLLEERGIIDACTLREHLQRMVNQREFRHLPTINRAIALEIWLQSRAAALPLPVAS